MTKIKKINTVKIPTPEVKLPQDEVDISSEITKVKYDYTFEVTVNDVTFKTKAEDLKTALSEFIKSPEFPLGIKTRVFMKFGKGKKLVTHTIPVIIARRLFSILSFKDNAVEILANKLTNKFNE